MGRPRKQPLAAPEVVETQEAHDQEEAQDSSLVISAEELAMINEKRKGKVNSPPVVTPEALAAALAILQAPKAPVIEQDPKKVQKDIKESNPDAFLGIKSVPRHKQAAYVKWHREAHTQEAHFEWCKENSIPFSWTPLQPCES